MREEADKKGQTKNKVADEYKWIICIVFGGFGEGGEDCGKSTLIKVGTSKGKAALKNWENYPGFGVSERRLALLNRAELSQIGEVKIILCVIE